jgi:hypothetical protein
MKRKPMAVFAASSLFVCLVSSIPSLIEASDHTNLEEGLPVQVEDAYATAYRNIELQFFTRYERTDDRENLFTFVPRLEYGVIRNAQLALEVPVLAGNADKTGSGDIVLHGLYNFNTESIWVPALALSGGIDISTGRNTAGLDTRLKLIASKMVYPFTTWLHRVHLNLEWIHNNGRMSEERANRYRAILGFSARLDNDTLLVTDLVREQQREKKKESNIFELGLRRQLTPLTLIMLGGGVGIGDESPKFQVTLGFQHSLSFPYIFK